MRKRDDKFPENGFEGWGGYMQAKIAKLEQQYCNKTVNQNKLSDIFKGISIFVNGYTIPSAEELKTLMSQHGGVYHTYQRNDDFIIASNLPDTKVKNMCLNKVVRPEWITESIASKLLLDYKDYLLYQGSKTQLKLNFVKNNDISNNSKLPFFVNDKVDQDFCIAKEKKIQPLENCNSDNRKEVSEHCLNIQSDKSAVVVKDVKNFLTSSSEDTIDIVKNHQIIRTAADPNYISEFYNNSRLHHISQLGACFKQYINDLRESSDLVFPSRVDLKSKIQVLNLSHTKQVQFEGSKTIMHIDMDCFFVSVGLRKRPDLKGKPVAVTHSKGGSSQPKRPGVDRDTEFGLYKQKQAQKLGISTGISHTEIETRIDGIDDKDARYTSMSEIASCSYEARAKGISNGMFMGSALRLCPDLQTIPYDFEGYKEVAYTLYNTVAQYTLDIEAVSCDEMYVDCTELLKNCNISVQDFATLLRDEIKTKTSCPCSTGFGGNRLQARLATKRAKPNGQFFLSKEIVDDFMFNIKLQDLPGVGRQTAHKLEIMGHTTCGSLQSLSLVTLQHHLGNKTGAQLYDQCRGRDSGELTFVTVRKSVSAEVNYGIRFENNDQCIEFLKQLSAEVHSRIQKCKVLGKCITLKLMVRAEEAPAETAKFMGHGFCNIINKSASLTTATDDLDVITKEVLSLYIKQKVDPKEMRGVGIQITKLELISNHKQNKGTISKFLTSKKTDKLENKSTIDKHTTESLPEKIDLNYPVTPKKNNVTNPITPKKYNVTSPKNKSPIIGSFKSPGKSRGRPKNRLTKPSLITSKNLISKFLNVQNSVKDSYKECTPKKEIHEAKNYEENPGLLGFSWQKVRELLRAWLESGQLPLPCDVNLIKDYMQEKVVKKNIDEVSILLRFLRRRTMEMCIKEWTEVNEHIVEHVQSAMMAMYGKELYF